MAQKQSPVTGDDFPELSEKYAAKKKAQGLSPVPDLQESGDMLDDLDFKITHDGIEVGIYGKAAPRADGHNNLSGESDLPLRQFLPNVGEGFTSSIEKEVEKIIKDAQAEETEIPFEALGGVESKADLYEVLGEVLDLTNRSDIRGTVIRNAALYSALSDLDLIDFL